MTVTVGAKRLLGASTLLGASQFTGQGNTNTAKDAEWELLFSTDDASVSIPSWTYIQSDMRAFSVSRGRANELSDMDAGTATITLDNRSRAYDPINASSPYSPNLRPMNRVWLRMRFNGATHDVFKGYVESYEQQYPELALDAVTVVHAVDEFKILALRNQPTSDPPRDSYANVVMFDQPICFWGFDDDFVAALSTSAAAGPNLISASFGAVSGTADGAIQGENGVPYAALTTTSTQSMNIFPISDAGEGPDLQGATETTVEVWVRPDRTPAGNVSFVSHRNTGTFTAQYQLLQTAGGGMQFILRDSGASDHTVSGGSLQPNAWNHIAAVASGATITLYINGVSVATTGWSAVVAGIVPTSAFLVGGADTSGTYSYDALAIYRRGLTADRVLAHYDAGANRGFARSQNAGERMGHLLDSISSTAPRDLGAGIRPLAGQWTGNGQNTLDALREAENAEAVDAVMFTAKDGTLTFLDAAHRSVSPHDTIQAVFGDAGGTELGYMDVAFDFSDSFTANTWNVTRDGGTTQTASDTTSISRYLQRPQSLTGLKLRDDSDALDVAQDMLAKYKEPLTRVLSITPKTMNVDVVDKVFQLEIGDRIQVKLTPPGGGARVDQTLFVQSISVDATPQAVFPTVKLGVSPV